MAIAAALVVLALAALYVLNNSSTAQVDPTNTGPLEQALTRVPAADSPGEDIAHVPRPPETVRTYYLTNASVTTVVYTRRGSVDDLRPAIERSLAANGWGAVGKTTPSAPPRAQRTWQQVYSDGTRVLQVELFTHGDVIAAIYVLQRARAGQ